MGPAHLATVLAGLLGVSVVTGQDLADCAWDPQLAKLSCNLKTIQTGPAVIPQVENSQSLEMQCSDLSLYESLVRPDQFGTLPSLSQLSIHYCKIRNLPDGAFVGLRNLKQLSVQGHNSAWSGSMTMQLQTNTLKNLEMLEVLDLSDNNIWGLPPNTLCHTPVLRTLNLTKNNIVEVSEIGLAEGEAPASGCQLLHLKTLDLSFNKISSFLPRDLSLAPGIQTLSLRGNRIAVLSDQSLTGLWSLASLDLANNQLAALPPTLFQQSSNLQKLFLENNSLSLLAPDTFAGLEGLLLLNMSRNQLTSHLLTDSIFAHLTKLVALDLSYNALTRVHPSLFRGQMSLQILSLQNNDLTNLSPASFSSLVNLHILLLSWNQLSSLPQAALENLASLSSLSLDHNAITALPPQFFSPTPLLQDLALNHNNLESVPEGINQLSRLRTLDLGENSISTLPAGFFANLTNLYGLRLAGNRLTSVSGDIFANNTNLHVLNLAHNSLATIEQTAFKTLHNLRALRLDNNNLKDINGLVASQKNLRWLNVSTNSLQWFDFAFIPKSLEWLDIHNNKIDRVGNYYSLTTGFSLATFDASFNGIKELEADTLLHSLQSIYLNNNHINAIAAGTFGALENLTRVELQGNQLTSLAVEALALKYTAEVPEFLVGGNPWRCDCETEWMKNVNHLSTDGMYPRILDLDTIMCARLGASNNATLVPLLHMRSEEFLCQYDAHCIPQCFCCDFFACDCRMQCPEGCACFHDNSWTNNIIQCSSRGHMDVPPLIPMDATAVYLDGNNMTELVNPGFIGRRRVEAVFLNNSLIRRVTNYSFEGLSEVHVLHLEDNHIEELAGNEFFGLDRLKELYLQNNFISAVGRETFHHLRELSVLRLDGNLLTAFPVWELVNNPMLVGLYLARNMWSCSCEYVRPFLAYQQKLGSKVVDADDLRCVADHFRGEALASMGNIACGDLSAPDFQSTAISSLDYTPILVSVLLAVLVIVIGYLVAFTFRKSIKEWMFKGKADDKNSSVYSKDKLFDVFISYALDDSDFVEQNFAQHLEHGATSYRLCLHQRDFPPTTPLSDTVSVAVESSTRAIIVLSSAYINNQWTNIRSAFMEAIKLNNTKVVFIQLEDVDLGSVVDLKHLLEDSPVVRWLDPGFWNKLRYFLPEPVYLTFHRNVTMRGTLASTSNLYQPVLGTQQQQEFKLDNPYQQQQLNSGSVYGSEHTYHSIDSNHIYHTLDPGSNPNLFLHFQTLPGVAAGNRVFINHNLDLVNPSPGGGAGQAEVHRSIVQSLHRSHPVLGPGPHPALHQQNAHAQQLPPVHQRQSSAPHNRTSSINYQLNQSSNQSMNHSRHSSKTTINHAHTNSTSSAKKLLSGDDEYIV